MIRTLLRLVLLVVVVVGIATFFFGYRWGAGGSDSADISADRLAVGRSR